MKNFNSFIMDLEAVGDKVYALKDDADFTEAGGASLDDLMKADALAGEAISCLHEIHSVLLENITRQLRESAASASGTEA